MLLFYYIAVSPLVAVVQPLPIVVGTIVELICTMTEMDTPTTITWTFNGAVIYTGSETTALNISVEISSADYGIYTCSASNEFGSDNKTIEIVQAGIYYYISCGYHTSLLL